MNAREQILGKLKAAPKKSISSRPASPPLRELSWDQEKMIAKFTEYITADTGVLYRAKDFGDALDKLVEVAHSESLRKVAASTDSVLAPLNLKEWGKKHSIEVLHASDFESREDFKNALFDEVQAGITSADCAIAESGTLCLVHDSNQPRLISLAPILHIVIVPLDRLWPVYERAIEAIFENKEPIPSHVTLITGPSMTADIMGVPFKGMHGPKRLVVILVD
jgi:L-lactate dehydrogenase complex protein LldG